jgi:hypothetical protein
MRSRGCGSGGAASSRSADKRVPKGFYFGLPIFFFLNVLNVPRIKIVPV